MPSKENNFVLIYFTSHRKRYLSNVFHYWEPSCCTEELRGSSRSENRFESYLKLLKGSEVIYTLLDAMYIPALLSFIGRFINHARQPNGSASRRRRVVWLIIELPKNVQLPKNV
ncbi:unnamed protein product, partial [Nesidiocoris tenuis]